MRVNVLGNGDNSVLFNRGTPGKLLICNMPPFDLPRKEVHATCMVDFKMMDALTKGEIKLDMYDWVLGTRPRRWMEMRPDFYLKYSHCIKAFHQHVPKYAQNATNYSCGHMAVDYAARVMKAEEIHIYGFDSIFDLNLRSYTDLLLSSDRGVNNTHRLANNWRPIFTNLFKEFKDRKFYLHHGHSNIKIEIPNNVEVVVKKQNKGVANG